MKLVRFVQVAELSPGPKERFVLNVKVRVKLLFLTVFFNWRKPVRVAVVRAQRLPLFVRSAAGKVELKLPKR